jgi:hypothetical protein
MVQKVSSLQAAAFAIEMMQKKGITANMQFMPGVKQTAAKIHIFKIEEKLFIEADFSGNIGSTH